jgi:hypothetical protein
LILGRVADMPMIWTWEPLVRTLVNSSSSKYLGEEMVDAHTRGHGAHTMGMKEGWTREGRERGKRGRGGLKVIEVPAV